MVIKDEIDPLDNFKCKIEVHNNVSLSSQNFKQILNHVNKGNIFERANLLGDRMLYTNDKGESKQFKIKEKEMFQNSSMEVYE